ncbi:MAG: ATP-binding cassette domain-containing protein, partial [Desulfurococcaceae archaeon]
RSLTVKRGDKIVLKELNAEFTGPGLYQVIGPNGSGKTTLLLAILGAIRPMSGTIEIGVPRGYSKPLFSFAPQTYSIPSDAPITVYEFLSNYLDLTCSWPRVFPRHDWSGRVKGILEAFHVPSSLWSEKIYNLSGGILQRVFLARAFVVDALYTLLDEPLSNIDPEGKVEVAEIIGEFSKNRLVIITSHDPVLLLDYTKKILLLGYGFYEFGDVDSIMKYDVLRKFYKKCAIEIEKHIHIADWH